MEKKKRVQYHCYHWENQTNLLFSEQSVDYSSSWSSTGTNNFHFRFFCQSRQELFNVLVSSFFRECILKFEAQRMGTSNCQF